MRIFEAELWNLELILPLFEQYRRERGMSENSERSLAFLANRIHFSESILFVAVQDQQAVGEDRLRPAGNRYAESGHGCNRLCEEA